MELVSSSLSLRPSVCVSSTFENIQLTVFFSCFIQYFVVNQLFSLPYVSWLDIHKSNWIYCSNYM